MILVLKQISVKPVTPPICLYWSTGVEEIPANGNAKIKPNRKNLFFINLHIFE